MSGERLRRGITRPAIVVIAGSVANLESVSIVLSGLPSDFAVPVVVALRLPRGLHHPSRVAIVLDRRSELGVGWAENGIEPQRRRVYVAPQDAFTTLDQVTGYFVVHPAMTVYPTIEPLCHSAAALHNQRAIAVILSGAAVDGARGGQAIHDAGGIVISEYRPDVSPAAPAAARRYDHIVPIGRIAAVLHALVMVPGAREWFAVGPESSYLRAVPFSEQ